MKLVLSKDGVKREIATPFAICIGRDDLDKLIQELQRVRGSMLDTAYGWFRVDPSHPSDGPSNTPPLPWTAR